MERTSTAQGGQVSAVTYGKQVEGGRHLLHGKEEGNKSKTTNLTLDPCHVDGAKAYGNQCPDVIFLLAQTPCSQGGGANFIVDAAKLARDFEEEEPELGSLLAAATVEQVLYSVTAAGKAVNNGPLVVRFFPNGDSPESEKLGLASGINGERTFVHCPNVFEGQEEERVRPIASSKDCERERRMIGKFAERMRLAMNQASRFHLEKGWVLAIDNMRLWHGREPYFDLERTLWRVWSWTNECNGLPSDVTPGISERRDCEV
jgi:hypothetical protein